jgi:hypothetical protein
MYLERCLKHDAMLSLYIVVILIVKFTFLWPDIKSAEGRWYWYLLFLNPSEILAQCQEYDKCNEKMFKDRLFKE